MGSVAFLTVRWDSSLYAAVDGAHVFNDMVMFSSFSRLLHRYLMSSRSHSCAGTSAAVLRFGSAVLQLQRSVQHRCHPGAPPEAAQLGGPFFVKVSSDSHVFLSAKGKHRLYCLTDELECH